MILPFGLTLPFYLSPRLLDPIVWMCGIGGVVCFIGTVHNMRDILRLTSARRKESGKSAEGVGTDAPARTEPATAPVAAAHTAAAAAMRPRQAELRPRPAGTHASVDSNPMRGFKTWCAHCKTQDHNALNCSRVRPVVTQPKSVRIEEEEYAV